jgi:hypothetical protein
VVQLRETEIDVLIRKGLLQADARNDVYAVRDALHVHFDRALGTAKRHVTAYLARAVIRPRKPEQ